VRRAHMLRDNRGGRLPQLLIALDTETDSIEVAPRTIEARLRFGWLAVTRRHRGLRWTPPRWVRFTTADEAWAAIEDAITSHRRAYVAAHNAGFDMRVIDAFRQLPARGWQLKGSVIEDPPTILRWRRGRESITVLDTLNWHKSSLAQLGDQLGLPKIDHDLVWGDTERDDAYCRRDVEIVLAAMQALVALVAGYDLGNFAPTLAGQAYGAFRHRHLSVPILIDDNPKALAIARDGYTGGRCEAYRLGPIRGSVTVFDVVSMYPSVMLTQPVPTVLRGTYARMTAAELAALPADQSAIADVTLTTEDADYPLVRDGRLIFPVGTFRTVLPAPELAHALVRGRVRRVHRVALYDAAVIFASYVREWWARRKVHLEMGDTAGAYFDKLMMNALYGKFGQRGEVYEPVGPTELDHVGTWLEVDAATGEVHKYRALGGLLSELAGEVEGRDSHPAIAATITSAARMRLLGLVERAGRANVVYVDTDSLFVRSAALRRSLGLVEGSELGQLKREREIARLVIHGLKDYTADGVRKTKGVRKTAIESAPGVFTQEMFVGLKGAVAAGDLSRQLIVTVDKHYRRTYDKGDVLPGGRVVPYRLG